MSTPSPPEYAFAEDTKPLLASVALELEKEAWQPSEPPVPVEETLKEAVTIIEKETPLLPPPLELTLAIEYVSVTSTENETIPPPAAVVAEAPPSLPVSQPLATALTVPQNSESPVRKKVVKPEKLKPIEKKKAPESMVSFREERNKLSDLSDFEQKALEELKFLVWKALNTGAFALALPSDTSNLLEEASIFFLLNTPSQPQCGFYASIREGRGG
ncbi:Phosphatidylinositol transfer protein SEC14 [Abeliophyllum distichum]|uniref:Phosphatidylinositol transfer protein SEC14 n=1 Tax=Abeliophyllum distichum TaxID=126358 RepID=A0ABD1S9I0_9LAMI